MRNVRLGRLGVAMALAGVLSLPSASAAAVTIVLKLMNIPGDSVLEGHSGEIEVLAFSSGLNAPFANNNPGSPTLTDVAITKFLDRASVPLLKAAADGTSIGDALFTFIQSGEHPFPFYQVTLKNVFVTGVSASVNGDRNALDTIRPIEFLSLHGSGIAWSYTPRDNNGDPQDPILGEYDPQLKP